MFRSCFPSRILRSSAQIDRSSEKPDGWFSRLLQSDEGATAVEYAVMLSLIIAACATAINLVGQSTLDSYEDSATKLEEAFSAS